MDNELHYLTFDVGEIWNEITTAYLEAGGDVLYPGDEKEMLLRAVQAVLVQSFAGIDTALRMATLRYAVGDYLDIVGENRFCERMLAQPATGRAKFTFKATGESGTLPAGTIITSDGVRLYKTQDDVLITGRAQEISVGIECTEAGQNGNGLTADTEMQLVVNNPAVTYIIITEGTAGGQNKEDDDTYRERIRTYGLTSVTTGPARQYESVAKAASSLVVDAKAVNGGAGVVRLALIVSDQDSLESVLELVKTACNDQSVRPLTDNLLVEQATEIPYKLDVTCTLPASADTNVRQAVSNAVAEYQTWQESVIGRPFNPEMLTAKLYGAGCVRVLIGMDSYFGEEGVTPSYTEIDGTSICKGEIVQVVNDA